MTDMGIGQIVTFLTLLAGFAFQIYRENRNRKWLVADRDATALSVLAAANDLREKVKSQHKEVIGEIKANTQVSIEAFTEANGVNAKILALNAQILELRKHPALAVEDIQRIGAIDERTAMHTEQLIDIQNAVKE